MEENEKLSIRINVADRYYPLKIAAADEERIRAAAKRINEKIMQYHQRYANRDIQDALSMAVLQYVLKLIEYEEVTDLNPLVSEIQKIDKQLDDFLSSITG